MSEAALNRKIEEFRARATPPDHDIFEIESKLLQGIFGCRTQEAVEASITYARFLNSVGITPDNHVVFLKMLEIANHWVIDALIGDRDPFLLLSAVQPNKLIVERCLAMLTRWHKGGIYNKNLSVIMGVLQSVFSSPRQGYRICPLTIADANAIGKHLDKDKGQDWPLNRAILEVLEKLSDLEDSGDAEMEEVAIHAAAIRNAFFDDRKRMDNVIPPVLLVTVSNREEISPRNEAKVLRLRKESTTRPPLKRAAKKSKAKAKTKTRAKSRTTAGRRKKR